MDSSSLKADIRNNTIKPYYIFTGDEVKIQDIYIEKLAGNRPIQRVDSFVSIAHKLTSGTLVSVSRCYVIRDDKEMLKEEAIWGNLEALIGSNLVVWVFTTIDKRNKFYKHFKDLICEFNHLNEDVLLKYVRKEIDLSERNARELIQICENDYGRILLEIQKIKNWRDGFIKDKEEPIPYDGAYLRLRNDGTIYQPPRDAIFMWVDAVLRRQARASYGLLQECIEIGESSLTLITVLYNNAKQVLQVQSYQGNEVTKATGLTAWQVKCAREKSNHYSIAELFGILDVCQWAESNIKMGNLPEELAAQYILNSVL